jgi:gliding motility-associated-like protein
MRFDTVYKFYLKKRFNFILMNKLLIFLFAILVCNLCYADGSKDCYLNQSDTSTYVNCVNIYSAPPGSGFGSNMNCPEYRRINIKIANPATEKICIGLRAGQSNTFYRVFGPGTSVVIPGSPVPTSGVGYIPYYKQSFIGPTIATALPGGYNAIVITPTLSGDYWIEFNVGNNFTATNTTQGLIRILDLTVISTTSTPATKINGRVHCKEWNFAHNGGVSRFAGPIYSYVADSIITSVTFPFGIAGYNWKLSMNSFGCTNVGIWDQTRKSMPGNAFANDTISEYDLFLTIPDPLIYPVKKGPNLSVNFASNVINPKCSSTGIWDSMYHFVVNSNIAKQISLFLNLNDIPDYQEGTRDVLIPYTLSAGSNTITWDGFDGLHEFVKPNQTITNSGMVADLGLTNIPLFDIETLNGGMVIQTVFPSSFTNTPVLKFDDSNIAGGLTDVIGCNGPCHPIPLFLGNLNTINTWYYAKQISLPPQSFTLVAPVSSPLSSSIVTVFDDCIEFCKAKVTLSHTLGLGPYSYKWSDPAAQTTSVATNLCAGTYTGYVLDFFGCKSTQKVEVKVTYPTPTVSIGSFTNTICSGLSTTLVASGANTYTLEPGSITGSTLIVSPLTTTQYSLYGTSSNGCASGNVAKELINVNITPIVTASALLASQCAEDVNTIYALGALSYTWLPIKKVAASVKLSPNKTTTYSVTGTGQNGCVSLPATTQVSVFPTPNINVITSNTAGCAPLCLNFKISKTPDIKHVRWSFDSNAEFTDGFGYCFQREGINTIKLFIRDTNNCGTNRTFSVNVYQTPTADFYYTLPEPSVIESRVEFVNQSRDASYYEWYNDNKLLSSDVNFSQVFDNLGAYNITLVAKTQFCSSTLVKKLQIEDDFTIYVPNAFTPDDNQLNDNWRPVLSSFKETTYRLTVFDKLGEVVYSSNDPKSAGWDGRYNGKLCTNDVYVWRLNLETNKGEFKNLTGTVFLQR